MQIKTTYNKNFFWAIVLLLLIFVENASVAKKLNASQAFDDTWNTATDLENELECMLQQKRAAKSAGASPAGGGSGQWSGWSEWSTCSRTCDGGIMQQIRRCNNPNGCKGENVRYRICNMQPCPEQQEFRAHQCAAYNDVPYDGTLYKWTPHYDYVEPCALTCRGRPAHLTDDISPETEGGEDSEHYDDPSVIVQLSARVQDGTRCRSGSLDMCIQGKCQRVGCDLKIGSAKKIDACGVCGGDSSSCSQPLYQWETAPMSQCSVTCGGGYKMSRPACRNRFTGMEVDDTLCSATLRPEPSVQLCNTHTCPPRWIADEWSPCSRLCGPGYRERMVVCAEETNGIKTRVSDIMCHIPKPPSEEPCILEECPKWELEDWSSCSVSCGQGIQMRSVECKSADGSLSAKCDPLTKPASAQQCAASISCDGSNAMSGGTIIVGSSGPISHSRDQSPDSSALEEEDDDDDRDRDNDNDDVDDDDESEAEVGDESGAGTEDTESVSYNDQPPLYSHNSMSRLHHEVVQEPRAQRLTALPVSYGNSGIRGINAEQQQPSTEPTFIKENEWSPCSVTCGEGIRRRPYKCKVFLEISRHIATVNDSLCEGVKPHDEVERCVEDPCILPSHGYDEQYPRDSIKVGVSEPGKTYVWREQGYTSCSASCLGGVEELIINCVREDNGRGVSPFLCAPETKPEARVRTCNDRPCPPRWNYSDYTPCSKSCGIGIKTREVQCIHEVTRGGENTMVVPNSMCPQPPPADRQYCNVLDCPVRWEVGEWSKCSHTCGYGIKERKVECKQIMAQEHKIERPESMCPSTKPPDKKPCNVKPCPPEDPKPNISTSNTTYIQHDPKNSKVTLKVGGAGVLFFGTQVKIKCPVKRYNRTKIKWSKDHKPLPRTRKFKVSKKGALRILDITFTDEGVYSCHAGLSSAEIQIQVKAKPGQNVEELERQESERLVRERTGTEPLTSADMTAAEGVNGKQQLQHQNGNGRERSIMEDEQSHSVQQAQDGLPQPASASSGGSRTNALLAMPYFQALLSNLQHLWPLQKFSNSRGQHILHERGLQFGIDLERFEQDEPAKIQEKIPKISNTKSLVTSSMTSAMKGIQEPNNINSNNGYENDNEQETEYDENARKAFLAYEKTEMDAMSSAAAESEAVEATQAEVDANANGELEVQTVATAVETEAESPHLPHERWQGHIRNGVGISVVSNDATGATLASRLKEFVTYKWRTSDWTECSQKCGAIGTGLRRRTVNCIRVRRHHAAPLQNQSHTFFNDATNSEYAAHAEAAVDNAYCEDYGLKRPTTYETCGQEECPHWVEGAWTECHQSRCNGRNVAIQKREVSCRYANETLANGCDEYDKPISRQECYNERCKGVWRVESWSECNAPCGRQGIKYRILQCVWYGSRRPAGNACKHQPRPAVMKVCKSAPCMNTKSAVHCKDTSRYCRNVRHMGLCRLHRYQGKCCKSCKINIFN